MGLHDNDKMYTTVTTTVKKFFKSVDNIMSASEHMAAFMMLASIVDTMAQFYAGATNNESDYGAIFRDFVDEYLNKRINSNYISRDFWSAYRCPLLHAYSEGKKYIFASGAEAHLQIKSDDSYNRRYLNIWNLRKDVEAAVYDYLNDVNNEIVIKAGQLIWSNFVNHFNNVGILTHYTVKARDLCTGSEITQVNTQLTATWESQKSVNNTLASLLP